MVFDNSSHHQIFSPSSHKLRFAVKPPTPPLGPTAILFNLSKKKVMDWGFLSWNCSQHSFFYIRCLGTVPNFETRWLHQGAWFFNGISLIFSGRCPLSLQGFKASHWYDHLPSHHRFHQWEFFQHDTNVTGRHVCSIKFWDAHQQRLKKPRHVGVCSTCDLTTQTLLQRKQVGNGTI